MSKMHEKGRALPDEVQEAAQQLLARRKEVRRQVRTLNVAVRRRVTAPDALLWSAATGFALGEVTRKRGPVSADAEANAHHRREEDAPAERPSTLQMIIRYVAIARPLLASASTWLGPIMQHMEARKREAEAEEAFAAEQAAAAAPTVPAATDRGTEGVTLAHADRPH